MLVSKEYTQTASAVLSGVLLNQERKPGDVAKVESILSKLFNGNSVSYNQSGYYIVRSASLVDAHNVVKRANTLGFKNTKIRKVIPDVGLFKQNYHVFVSLHVKTFGNQISKSIYDLVAFIVDLVDAYVVEIKGQGTELNVKVNDVKIAALLSASFDRYLVTVDALHSEPYRIDVHPSGINNYVITLSFPLS